MLLGSCEGLLRGPKDVRIDLMSSVQGLLTALRRPRCRVSSLAFKLEVGRNACQPLQRLASSAPSRLFRAKPWTLIVSTWPSLANRFHVTVPRSQAAPWTAIAAL